MPISNYFSTLTFQEINSILPPDIKIKCIALAPPPVYRTETDLPDDVLSSIEIFINNNDCVPRLTLGSLAR